MKQAEAIKTLSQWAERHNALVVSDIGSQSLWLKAAGDSERHLYLSGPMGMASSVALGVAAANPGRAVLAICGDGALAMNLTSLATISNIRPTNLTVAVMNNGIYEFTKSLPSPSCGVEWNAIDKSFPGFRSAVTLDGLDSLDPTAGPHFIHAPIEGGELPPGPGLNAVDVHHRFRAYVAGALEKSSKQSC